MSNKIDLNFDDYQEDYLYKNIAKEVKSFRAFCDGLDERSKILLPLIDFKAVDELENGNYHSNIAFLEKVLACINKKVIYHCNGRDYENTILLMKAFVSENQIFQAEFSEHYSIPIRYFIQEIKSYRTLKKLNKLANDFQIRVVDK